MKGKRLTPAAQADRDEFDSEDSCCSCHLSPPCGYCTHPGNPANQECDESCWEDDVDDEIDDLFDRSNWPPENTTRGNADGSTNGSADYRNRFDDGWVRGVRVGQ